MSVFNGRADGLDRILRKHKGETGVITAGWLGGHLLASNKTCYHFFNALIDGKPQKKSTVYPRTKRPRWVGVAPGQHRIKLANQDGIFYTVTVDLDAAEAVVLSVRGPDMLRFIGLRNAPRIWSMQVSTDPRSRPPGSAKPIRRR